MATEGRKSQSIRTVIKNYGLMWRRDQVFWGRGRNRGVLHGRRSRREIDFRDSLAHRWHYFSWFGLLSVNKNGELSGWDNPSKRVAGTIRSTLNEIEGVLIAATEPAFNKQGARFRGIARYRQVAHPDAEYVPQKELRDLVSELVRKVDQLRDDVILGSR